MCKNWKEGHWFYHVFINCFLFSKNYFSLPHSVMSPDIRGGSGISCLFHALMLGGPGAFLTLISGLGVVDLTRYPCADPGIFVRGGVQVSLTKKALTTLIFFYFFFSPLLILQKSNGQVQRNLSFFKVPEGVQHFPGGGPTFSRGGGLIAYSL